MNYIRNTNNIHENGAPGILEGEAYRGLCFAAAPCVAVLGHGATLQCFILCSGKVSSLYPAGIELALLVN